MDFIITNYIRSFRFGEDNREERRDWAERREGVRREGVRREGVRSEERGSEGVSFKQRWQTHTWTN